MWSPHLLRLGSAGHDAMHGFHSQQTVVLSFPTVLHVNQDSGSRSLWYISLSRMKLEFCLVFMVLVM